MITYLEKPYSPEQIRHILNSIIDRWFFTRFREFSLPQLFGVMEIHSYLNYFSYHFESENRYQLLNHDIWSQTNTPLDTGHARMRYLKEKTQLHNFQQKIYDLKIGLVNDRAH